MQLNNIDSLSNKFVKEATSLHVKKNREQLGLFLVEGYKNIVEFLGCGLEPVRIFVKEGFAKTLNDGLEIHTVNEKILKKISTTDSPCEIVGIFKQKKFDKANIFNKKEPFVIILDRVQDAGNLGNIVRSAAAFGVDGIVLTTGCIDIFNPKVIRASAGNLFKVPIIEMTMEELKETLKGAKIYSTALTQNSKPIKGVDFKGFTAIAFGNEANGLSDEIMKLSTDTIHIPTKIESLNLSNAVSIVLFEAFRGQ